MKSFKLITMFVAAFAFCAGVNTAQGQHRHDEGGEHEHGQGEKAGHSHEKATGHGGAITMSKEFHVETVFLPDQIRLYLYDGNQNPMHVKHWEKGLVSATGDVRFRRTVKGRSAKPSKLTFKRAVPGEYACPMHSAQRSKKPGKCPKCDMKFAKEKMPKGTLWSCPMHPDENGKSAGECEDCGMKYKPQDYLVASVDLDGLKAGDAKATFVLKNLPGEKETTLEFAEKFVPAKKGGHDDGEEHEHGKHEHSGHGH